LTNDIDEEDLDDKRKENVYFFYGKEFRFFFVEINYDYVNAIFIPRRDFRDSNTSHWQSRFLGFSNADSIVRQLRQQLLAIDRPHIEQCQTQRAWLTHASRMWDMITKSSQVKEKLYSIVE
jgi:hypothetical protein